MKRREKNRKIIKKRKIRREGKAVKENGEEMREVDKGSCVKGKKVGRSKLKKVNKNMN